MAFKCWKCADMADANCAAQADLLTAHTTLSEHYSLKASEVHDDLCTESGEVLLQVKAGRHMIAGAGDRWCRCW